MDEDRIVKTYRVTLRGGQWSDFPNTNYFDDYPLRLQSGIYQITWHDGKVYPITPQSVASIEELQEDTSENSSHNELS